MYILGVIKHFASLNLDLELYYNIFKRIYKNRIKYMAFYEVQEPNWIPKNSIKNSKSIGYRRLIKLNFSLRR